jgi:hypothetical protein
MNQSGEGPGELVALVANRLLKILLAQDTKPSSLPLFRAMEQLCGVGWGRQRLSIF